MSKIAAAFFYEPSAYSTSGPKLMGRNAAGESLLKGLFKYAKSSDLYAYLTNREQKTYLEEVRQHFKSETAIKSIFATEPLIGNPIDLLYYPAPNIAHQLWYRSSHGHSRWSVCGVTHTTSSTTIMDGIAELATSPAHPWDAVICTSEAVKKNILFVLEAQEDYLKSRLGAKHFLRPQFPVIPLGVHADDFSFTPAQKILSRNKLGISEDTIVVLFMGRLSFHAKAHPAAMYKAIQKAATSAKKKVVLLECGWHANTHIRDAYISAAQTYCPQVTVMILDGRNSSHREIAWSASDIFCSLSDNIQETFGITPIEAMAAKLPVVVSDWNGYKESVRHGVDGFRIPTRFPKDGLGDALAMRHALQVDNYDMYCGNVCMTTEVDISAAAEAFKTLFLSPDLRASMGSAGRVRSEQHYDWAKIIPQYEALWAELKQTRTRFQENIKESGQEWPARPNPYKSFCHYPTHVIDSETQFSPIAPDSVALIRLIRQEQGLAMNNFAKFVLPSDDMMEQIATCLYSGSLTAREIAQATNYPDEQVISALAFLLKLGLIRVSHDDHA